MGYPNPNLLSSEDSEFGTTTGSWAAGPNTTIARNTARYANSPASLSVTAVAAGTVTINQGSRVPVTAGTEYVAHLRKALGTARSGQTASLSITWHTAASGGSVVSTSTSPAQTIASSTSWSSGPTLVATAPAGSTHASLSVSLTGAPAGGVHYVDAFYLGTAPVYSGSLLGYNAQSLEMDLAPWSVTGGTFSRTTSQIVPNAGEWSGLIQASAPGTVVISTASGFPVTPGVEYLAWVHMYSQTVVWPVTTEIRWFDGAGAEVGVPDPSNWTLQAGGSAGTRFNAVGTAPAGAVTGKLVVQATVSAAGDVLLFDEVFAGPAPNAPGNLLTFDEFSAESRLPAWNASGATVAHKRLVLTTGEGHYVVEVAPTQSGLVSVTLDRLVPVIVGNTYKVQGYFIGAGSADLSRSMTYRTRVDWYDDSGTLVLADDPDQFYTSASASAYFAATTSETRQCPEGATRARVTLEFDHTSTTATEYWVDRIGLYEATAEYTISVSDEAGFVSLVVNTVPSSGVQGKFSVVRVDQDGSLSPVRGYGSELTDYPFTQSPIVVEDYEAPLGTSVWYQIMWFSDSGTMTNRLFTRSISSPTMRNPSYVWLKHPGMPALNTRVMMETPISWARAARSTRYQIVNRRNPVHVTGVRGGRTGSLSVLVWDEGSNELLDSLLDSGSPVLIQASPGYGISGNLYLSVGDVEVSPVGAADYEGWRWSLDVAEIDRPAGGIQGSAGRTWQDVLNAYATWEDALKAFESWAGVLTEGA